MKFENTETAELDNVVIFDGKEIFQIRFDLEHINRGWNTTQQDYNLSRRSFYTSEDVKSFFEQFGYYNIEWEEGRNKFLNECYGIMYYRYISFVTDYNSGEQKKIVVDIPLVFSNEGVVVTIY